MFAKFYVNTATCRTEGRLLTVSEWVSEYGLMSHPTHNRSFEDNFYTLHCPTNSVKALKDKMVCWHIKDQSHENYYSPTHIDKLNRKTTKDQMWDCQQNQHQSPHHPVQTWHPFVDQASLPDYDVKTWSVPATTQQSLTQPPTTSVLYPTAAFIRWPIWSLDNTKPSNGAQKSLVSKCCHQLWSMYSLQNLIKILQNK